MILIIILTLRNNIVFADVTTQAITPSDSQYMELKLLEITDVEGKDKQVVMEWWSHNVNFKGLDLRFEYDDTKLKPSNVETNEFAYDNSIFKLESIFKDCLDYLVIQNNEVGSNIVRMNMSLLTENINDEYMNTNQYIKKLDNGTYYMDTTGNVLIGRMTFRLFNGSIDETTFKLKTTTNSSPITGIKINIDGINYYEEQKVFRFTLSSGNAYLKNIEKSLYNDESEELVYTQIENFDEETFEYEIIVNEYKDYISLIPTLADENSSIKVKVPKRDENGELVYQDDNITYEEKDLDAENKINVKLNELGKEDTIIEFIVTSEDGQTTNTYKIRVHRPFGTIKGKIQLGDGLRESMELSYGITTKYIANITLYDTGIFNWDGIVPGEVSLDDLDLLEKSASAKSDDEGDYEIYVIPGSYDCIFERLGFLAQIVTNITINESDEINLGTKILLEGDANRTGIIDLDDVIDIVNFSGANLGDAMYDEKYDYGQKDFIGLDDLVSTIANMYNVINITEY